MTTSSLVEARFNTITVDRVMSLPHSIYRQPCIDYDSLHNPVELWLEGGGKFCRKARSKISALAEVLVCWH